MRPTPRHSRPLVELPKNVTPPWLLPFWRLVRTRAMGDYALAWRMLPSHLPAGMATPRMEELAAALVVHGLVD